MRRATKLPKAERRRVRLEMIPLMDCMFLLLVYFIYAMLSMTVHRGIKVNLPTSSTAVLNKEEYLSLTVTREGRFFWNKEEVSQNELSARLRSWKEGDSPLNIYLNADRKAYHEYIVTVLDILREARITRVFLETKPGEVK